MIILFDQLGHRLRMGMLCKDRRLRDFALHGTFQSCVKVYRSLPAAKKTAARLNLAVAHIPAGLTLDASGCVTKTVPALGPNGEPGYESHTRHPLHEFVVQPQTTAKSA